MAAAQQNRPARDVVDFPPNTPITVALKFNQGKIVSGQYGERVLFTLCDGRVMFCDPDVAGQIAQTGINVREPFTLTQRWDGQKGSPRTWEVARVGPAIGEQPDGTFAVPKLPPGSSTAAARAQTAPTTSGSGPAAPGTTATTSRVDGLRLGPEGATQRKPPASALVAEANALVDAYAEVLARALTQYEGRIKPDEVRSILLSAYIQRRQLSSVA